MKINTHPTIPTLSSLPSSCTCPFQQLSVDLITNLLLSNGFDSLLVVVDHSLSKGVILTPCNKTIHAKGVAELFFKNIFLQFGLHDHLISDWGPQFMSTFTTKLACILRYDLKLSTAYHPQMDRETEQVNQEIETYLQIFCQGQPDKWTNLIPMTEFTHYFTTHLSTQKTPFSLILGYEPRDYLRIGQTFLPALEDQLALLKQAQDEALAAHMKTQQLMKEWVTTKFTPWKIGNRVWLEGKNLHLYYPTKKLAPKQEGPFEISQVISPTAYHLQLPPTWKIHNVFHTSLLLTYWETAEHVLNFVNPPPEETDSEEEYEVAKILSPGDPLANILILYLGKDTPQQRTLGNLRETFNMPTQSMHCTNNETVYKGLCGVNFMFLSCLLDHLLSNMSSSSSNSSPSHSRHLDTQCFHHIFPAALPCCQHNILYATILQQPSLVTNLEWQSSYEEDDSIQSLVHIFHHLYLTQIYLGSFEPHTDHIISSTLHIASALGDTLDLMHDHGFHHHVLALPPCNLTLTHIFHPIYHTLSAVEWDTYEESDLRLVNHISSPTPALPIPAPSVPSIVSLETPTSSPLSTTATLIDDPADPCPTFHQNHTASYPTQVIPWILSGPNNGSNSRDYMFSLPCCWASSCQLSGVWMSQLLPMCPQSSPVPLPVKLLFFLLLLQPPTLLLSRQTLCPLQWPRTCHCWLSLLWGSQQRCHLKWWRPSIAHALPAMVFFFLFLFVPLFAALLLTV